MGGPDSFEMLFCRAWLRGFNPLPAKAVLPLYANAYRGREIFGIKRLRRCGYMLTYTGGEKYSEFSDSVAVAICRGKQGAFLFFAGWHCDSVLISAQKKMKARKSLRIEFDAVSPTDGREAEAVNVRPEGGKMTVVGIPAVTATLTVGDRLLGTDECDGRCHYFVVRGADVLVAGYSEGGRFMRHEQLLFHATGPVAGMAWAKGGLLTVATAGGLEYVARSDKGYAYLGKSPDMPIVCFGVARRKHGVATLRSASLSGDYDRWQSPLDDEDSAMLQKRFGAVSGELLRSAESDGCILGPTIVCMALRLSDGTLLWSDSPTVVGQSPTIEAVADVTLSNGVRTVAESRVECDFFCPTLTVASYGIGRWKDYVKAVEIYAGERWEQPSVALRCEQSAGVATDRLRMSADYGHPAAQLHQLAQQTDLRRVAVITDIDALMAGTVKGEGLRPASSGGIAGRTMEIDCRLSGRPSETHRFRPAPFAAQVIAAVGGEVFCGDLTWQLPSAPALMSFADGKSLRAGESSVSVSVEIPTPGATARVVHSTLCDFRAERLNSLICYPDSRARRMVFLSVTDGVSRQAVVDLVPSADGRCAYAVADGGFVMEEVEATVIPEASPASFRQSSDIVRSEGGNPLLWQRLDKADNAGVTALMPSFRYGSSWLLGRSPVCLFSPDGLRLLSFDSRGKCTASTLISRRTVASSDLAVATDDGIAFVDTCGELCRYRGSRVESTGVTVADATSLGFSLRYGELWVSMPEKTLVVRSDNRSYCRVPKIDRLAGGRLAVTGVAVRELDMEEPVRQSVVLKSRALPAANRRLHSVEWDFESGSADVRLNVYGENGHSCHGMLLSKLSVRGEVGSPLRQRPAAPWVRTIRVELEGMLHTGNAIYSATCRFTS